METNTLVHIVVALLAPLPVMRRHAALGGTGIIYLAGSLFVAWALGVVAPVACILAAAFAYFSLSSGTNASTASRKNPHP